MSKTYTLNIELLSRAIIGSAEGYGVVIDTDIMLDDFGIPYIPARRIKGCLRDSAIEVMDMLYQAGINEFIDLTTDKSEKFKYSLVNKLFGRPGLQINSSITFSNLNIADHEALKEWLSFLMHDSQSSALISREAITAYFTDITQQTAIDDTTGTAQKHSLRTVRSIRSGFTFSGEILIDTVTKDYERLLLLSAMNLRYIGSIRTRGFGKVCCGIDGISDKILKELEGLCIN